MPTRSRPARWVKAPMVPDALGYVWVAGRGILQRVNVARKGTRRPDPTDILLPEGYGAEVVASGFDEPVHCFFAPDGRCFITEGGYRIDSPPRILQLDTATGDRRVVFEIPADRWNQAGCLTGCAWHDGYLYYPYNDHIGRFRPDGSPEEVVIEEIVTGLPSRGDHQVMPPTFGPDGALLQHRQRHERRRRGSRQHRLRVAAQPRVAERVRFPARGVNYETQDVTGSLRDKARTGAFVPFGTTTERGQVTGSGSTGMHLWRASAMRRR
ncbi:MAG: hypothetical protein KY439_03575 [Actinobacteria bacterium]|nr:hypothetical protein [Actinomycetota bacterium]